MATNHRRFGFALIVFGLVLLVSLRLWASPVALAVTGRPSPGIVAFIAIPIVLVVIGAGIVSVIWGPELGFGG